MVSWQLLTTSWQDFTSSWQGFITPWQGFPVPWQNFIAARLADGVLRQNFFGWALNVSRVD
jgi:hypothetical protein